jgi:hypothetical protein
MLYKPKRISGKNTARWKKKDMINCIEEEQHGNKK